MGRKITEIEKSFNRGWACALATIIKAHGCTSEIEDIYGCNYLSLYQLRKSEVDEFDIQALKPILKEVNRKRKINKGK